MATQETPGAALTDAPEAVHAAVVDGRATLPEVRAAAEACRAGHNWERAPPTLVGEGPVPARWMLVGEQPGDREDVEGAPFVGPAGRVLDDALVEAGIDRERTFVTNVVKHFKWRASPGGKRRLHERPNRVEVGACLPWVESELTLVRPNALVLMGATAAQALLGPDVRVTRDHGRPFDSDLAPLVLVTIHPSAGFVADLRIAARA